MPEASYAYCDVSLPVPLDQLFTYSLPLTVQHRAKPGCRLMVPFGSRKLTGFILRCHNSPPDVDVRSALRLVDEEPVLGEELVTLGRWIANYYCVPLGEVLRIMAPLASEIRSTQNYSLTDRGRDSLRQLALASSPNDAAIQLLGMLEHRPLSAAYLTKKHPQANRLLSSLAKRGFVRLERGQLQRDPLRAPASKLRVQMTSSPPEGKRPKAERELIAYLELHPGSHNLRDIETTVRNAGKAARSLARKGVLALKPEPPLIISGPASGPHILNASQQKAFDSIRQTVEEGHFHTYLLHGVTGSGKTEIYLNAIEAALAQGRSALLMVPEIALTPAVAGQFFHRFPDRVAILHSAFTDVERSEQWRRIRSGEASVVVGTRSGVFAPVKNLGLIVVDEEQDGSYKQGETPRYNGRDVAIVRARTAGACVILGSATPSMETRYNAESGKYTLLELPERIQERPLANVELIDMRAEFLETRQQSTFSRRMLDALRLRLEKREQTMLLLNRRGFSSFLACRACGERMQCVNCSVTLTFHRRDRRMLCHYCNYAAKVPSLCPACGSEYVQFVGTGSEKVEEELRREFPEARIARMDRDTVTGRRQYETILQEFRNGSYDILVGTQMIAKGHDIPNVTLVGVVNADIGLGMPDFRAAERTFQLLTQVAGRAGRGDLPGEVLVQTINPDHYAIRLAATQNYILFYEKELQFRRQMRYPPFSALANLLIRSESQEDAMRMSAEIGQFLTPSPEGIKVLGPAEASLLRVEKEYRYQLLIKATSRKRLNELLQSVRRFTAERKWSATALVIDVDPLSLL